MVSTASRLIRPETSLPGALSQQQLDAYWRDGFVVIPGCLDASFLTTTLHAINQLARLARGLSETCVRRGTQFVLSQGINGEQYIDRIVGVGGVQPVLARLGQHPTLVSIATQILRSREMVQLINQVHYKFPNDNVAFDWHQDSLHRRYGTEFWTDTNGTGSFVEIIAAIDPMTLDNGPIYVIPGSHLDGHIPVDPLTKKLPSPMTRTEDAVPVLLAAGDLLVMGPYTIHCSHPNTGPTPRRTFLNGFASQGANRRIYPYVGTGASVNTSTH
jgi:ectoine hydroxylase-related dioxygenase (phytanoyl-CoA dioxygenase family)